MKGIFCKVYKRFKWQIVFYYARLAHFLQGKNYKRCVSKAVFGTIFNLHPHFQTPIFLCHWYKSSHYILFLQNLLYANEVFCLLITRSSRIKHRVAWEIVTNYYLNKHAACNVSVEVVICVLQVEGICSPSARWYLSTTHHGVALKKNLILFWFIHYLIAQFVIFVHIWTFIKQIHLHFTVSPCILIH
jgi:hypothetical protein